MGRAGFKPIGPISSNPAPRQSGSRAPPTTNANLHFLSKLLVHSACAGAAQCFLSCFERPKRLSKFSNDLSKYSINSLYCHHQNTPNPWFTKLSVFRWNSCGLWQSLQWARSKLEKTQEGPTQGRSQTISFGGATGGATFATRGAVNGLCRTFRKIPTPVAWRHAENFGGATGGPGTIFGGSGSPWHPLAPPLVPHYFLSVGYLANENPSELRGF